MDRDDQRIIKYLQQKLENSMIGYEVNGNPIKRRFSILNIAKTMLRDMHPRVKKHLITFINSRRR